MKVCFGSNKMTDNVSVTELSTTDRKALFIAFPDLNQLFPTDIESEYIVKYMDHIAESCGVPNGAAQVLEFAAVAAAAKLRVKIAQGNFSAADVDYMDSSVKSDALPGAEAFKQRLQKGNVQPAVNPALYSQIGNMDFNTVISMLPLQDQLCKQWGTALRNGKARSILTSEKCSRYMCLEFLGGNETKSGMGFKAGEFNQTIGRRLINGPTAQGDDNDIFKAFTSLHMLSNALQAKSCFELGKTFPELEQKIRRETQFFRRHAAETLAVSNICAQNGIKINDIEQLKAIIQSEETKNYAYGTHLSVLDMYALPDVKNGRCAAITPRQSDENLVSAQKDIVKKIKQICCSSDNRSFANPKERE